MRSVRDLAAIEQWLLKELRLERVSLVGLGFGGWVAAEMASLSPRQFCRLVLVGALGIKPASGEILDQAILGHEAYVRAGFAEQSGLSRPLPLSRTEIAWNHGISIAKLFSGSPGSPTCTADTAAPVGRRARTR